MESGHSSWRKKEGFLLGKVENLQDVWWSGLCMVTAGETVSTWGVRALKQEAGSL